MLTFFRRIRKGLLGTGATRKYLVYAVGEILLVMVGILLALQINNWNEERKERALEAEILQEIAQNLTEDQEDHNQNISYLNRSINSSNIVLKHLNNKLPYHDSLTSHFGWLTAIPNFVPVKSGYQNLLSNGVNIIQNDTLRRKISFIYDHHYVWLKDYLKDRQNGNNQPLLLHMTKKFKALTILKTAVPLDYQSLWDDHEFNTLIQQSVGVMELIKSIYLPIIDLNNEIIANINTELKSR